MITETTTPRRALDETAPQSARPRRRRRDWRLAARRLRDARTDRRPADEHQLLVGPGGVPVWTRLPRL